MLPADKRFHGDDASGVEVDRRLIVQKQFSAFKRTMECRFDGHALQRALVHLRIEEPVGVATAVLDPVQRAKSAAASRLDGVPASRGPTAIPAEARGNTSCAASAIG